MGKGKFLTGYRIDTPQLIPQKFVMGDYVDDLYACATLGANLFNGISCGNGLNITTLFLFIYMYLFC